MRISIKEIGLILLISIVSAVLFNSVSASGVDYIYTPPVITNNTVLSLYEAKKMYDAKEALFIDARPESQYKREHIQSAINVPYNSKDKKELVKSISKEDNIIVYCFSKRCSQARRLGAALKKLGFIHVAVFEDGIVEWKKAKYPLEGKTGK